LEEKHCHLAMPTLKHGGQKYNQALTGFQSSSNKPVPWHKNGYNLAVTSLQENHITAFSNLAATEHPGASMGKRITS
jgi:hypothetical protein